MTHSIKPLYHISLLLVLALLLSSCGSGKQATVKPVPTAAASAMPSLSEITRSLSVYSDRWERISIPVTMRLRKPSSISVSGTALMERGKSITLSFRFLGMEMAVMHITSDSIIALDKYHNRYVAESLRQFLGGVPVDISDLQDLLLGHPFLLGSTRSIADDAHAFDFRPDHAGGCITMIPSTSPSAVEYGFTFDYTMTLIGAVIKAGSGNPVTITYGLPDTTTFGPIATSTAVAATFGKTEADASLEWSPRKARWNTDVKLRTIEIPVKYQRISTVSLLRIFSSL